MASKSKGDSKETEWGGKAVESGKWRVMSFVFLSTATNH